MGDDVSVVFGAKTGAAEDGADRIVKKIGEVGEKASSIGDTLGNVGALIAEAFTVDKIAEFVDHFSELGELAVRNSEMLGISVEEVQKLGFAARMTGGDAEGMTMSLARLERNMAEAQSGTGKAAEAFHNLGISLDDLKTKSPDQILGMIADKFAATQDGATKTAYAMDLLGRSAAQMIPLFDQGSAGLERMGIIAQQTGSVMSAELAEAFAKAHQQITVMKTSSEGAGVALMSELLPAVNSTVGGLTQFWQELDKDISEGGVFHSVIAQLVTIFEMLVGVLETVATVMGTVGAMIAEAPNGFKAMGDVAADAADKIKKQWQEVDQVVQKVNAEITGGTTPSAEGKPKPTLPPAPAAGGEGKDTGESQEIQMEKNDLQTELDLQKIGLETRKEIDQEKVASGQLSHQKELADLREAAGEEFALQTQALDKAMSLYDEDTVQYHEYMNKKLVIAAQFQAQIAKLDAQSAAEQKKSYDTLFGGIKSAMDGMVSGILQGTQTFQQAMLHLVDNLAVKFAQLAANKLLTWTESELESVQVTQTADAAKVASNTAAAGAGNAVGAAKMIKEIESSAATTYAGVFAFLSPVMGPAAAIPAGISAGAVGAMTGLVSLDVGAWNLNNDMVAQLHAGEMVVPRTFAQGIRDGSGIGGGGGDNYTINVNAIDTQTGAQFLKNNAGVIASTIAKQVRNGNSSLRMS